MRPGERSGHREVVFSGLGEWRLAYDGRYKLVWFGSGERLLFDLMVDPWEDRNLASTLPDEVERLEELIEREKGKAP